MAPIALKNVLAIGFRHRNALAVTFVSVLLIAIAVALLWPPAYESEMKILVKRARIDPIVTPGQPPTLVSREEITEEELNSAVELLKSNDVLRQVVLETGLYRQQRPSMRSLLIRGTKNGEAIKVDTAVLRLAKRLSLEVSKKSHVILARYSAADPKSAANVLQTLSKVYLEKLLQLRQGSSEAQFFQQETEKYRQQLADAERKLAEFPRAGGTVDGALERDIAVHKLGDLQLTLDQTRAAILETKKRIAVIERSAPSLPTRITTQVHTAENPQLRELRGTLLTLQLKRTELLQKYQPTYRAVTDVDEEVAQTQRAISAAERSPTMDQTTDRDPVYEWQREELTKARTELRGLEGRATATARSIDKLQENARQLHESSITQQGLTRTAKMLEERYEMYVRKQEEARIANAMDTNQLLNVQIAEPPTIPSLPNRSLAWSLLTGVVLAVIAGTACVLVREHLDESFRTPHEVQQYLRVPVLAALPKPTINHGAATGEIE